MLDAVHEGTINGTEIVAIFRILTSGTAKNRRIYEYCYRWACSPIKVPTFPSHTSRSRRRRRKMCCWSSYTWPAYIWSVVSVVAAVTVSFSIYFSNWVEIIDSSRGNVTSLSPYRTCVNQRERITVECSDYLNFDRILSDEWRACTILLGIGACLLILVAITSLFGMVVPRLFSKVVTVLMAITQGIAGECVCVCVRNRTISR